ncbi:MAG: phosphatase PAP2 family protein, partial [Gemmatimonadota bacterium]
TSLADGWLYHHGQIANVYDRDWARLFRAVGYFPTWLLIAVAVWLEQRPADAIRARRNGLGLLLAPGLTGLAAEVVKLLVRRDRPGLHDGDYAFRSFLDHPFRSTDFGLPSSHAAVAFGGAALAAQLFPRAAPVLYLLALGCGVTRILAGAHFASDVAVAAALGVLTATLLGRRMGIGRDAPSVSEG